MEQFAQQEELRVEPLADVVQIFEEVEIEAVGHIQPQTVNAELLSPLPYAVEDVIGHRGVAQVELYEIVMPLPALIPEAVVVIGVAVEVYVEPILVGGVPALLENVLERPESASHMIEYAVQHDLYARLVQSFADLLEILVGAEAAVDL